MIKQKRGWMDGWRGYDAEWNNLIWGWREESQRDIERESKREREGKRSRKKYHFEREISSGRVIKSESQQTFPRLPPSIFSSLFPSLYCHLLSLHSSALISLHPLPLNLLSFCVSLSALHVLLFPCSWAINFFCLPRFAEESSNGQTQRGVGRLRRLERALYKNALVYEAIPWSGVIHDPSEWYQQSVESRIN